MDNHLVFVFIFIVIPKSIPHVLEMKDLSYSLKGFLFFPFFPTTNSRKGPNFDNLLRLFFYFFLFLILELIRTFLIPSEGGGTSVHRLKIKISINYSTKCFCFLRHS